MHVDIKVNDDTIRVYTTHLQSLQFQKSDYEKIERIKEADEDMVSDFKNNLFPKLRRGITYRKIQTGIVRQVLNDQPLPIFILW